MACVVSESRSQNGPYGGRAEAGGGESERLAEVGNAQHQGWHMDIEQQAQKRRSDVAYATPRARYGWVQALVMRLRAEVAS